MTNSEHGTEHEYVTAMVGDQMFGLPILRVQDVFVPERLTRVPLARPEIAGVLNLRGRIVTLIDLAQRLHIETAGGVEQPMAIGVELGGESYGLLVSGVGEVLKLDDSAREPNPINLDPRLARALAGVHRLDGKLVLMLDIDRVLDLNIKAAA